MSVISLARERTDGAIGGVNSVVYSGLANRWASFTSGADIGKWFGERTLNSSGNHRGAILSGENRRKEGKVKRS